VADVIVGNPLVSEVVIDWLKTNNPGPISPDLVRLVVSTILTFKEAQLADLLTKYKPLLEYVIGNSEENKLAAIFAVQGFAHKANIKPTGAPIPHHTLQAIV